nr:AmmeMemoRadiSam system protein B [Arsenicicoccus dermatophilus]
MGPRRCANRPSPDCSIPRAPRELAEVVDRLLGAVSPGAPASPDVGPAPADPGARAVIAPHAGYLYSGSTAAAAYRALDLGAARRVAVLGPTHRVPVRGVAAPESGTWRTPLGELTVDVADLQDLSPVVVTDAPHAPEHSIEVHLPFAQRLAPGVVIAPLAVGRASKHEVADVIDRLLADPGTVVVISSDLSHYLPYDDARRVDRATLDQVTTLHGTIDHEQACGATPVNGLMEHARRSGATIRELASCSSGDTAGDRARVVGYAALALEAAS